MRVIIHLTFLLLPLSVVLLADDFPDSSNSGPLYLCDERSWEAHFETEYVALDQSTRWDTAHLRHKSFALRFQLTGKCENGFLICYPGSLDPSGANWTYGISPETQFQVPNHQESKVAEECLEYQKKFDKNKNQIASLWHGVRVSAPKEFGGIMIELSISKEKYNLSDVQSFNIEFGNARKLMTKVTDETGREIKFSKDEAIRKAFLSNKIKSDAKLRNYTGLWMLGLDVLPMNNQAKMQLHVYRDCGCEMHAWFVHPSDEVPPLLSDHPVVSVDCQTTVQEADSQQFALPTPVGVGRAIRMRRRLNKNPEGIDERVGMSHAERLKSIVNCTCLKKQRRKRAVEDGELLEIARHEAGHAAALLTNTDAVRFISVDIVANGDNLGNTMGDFEPESYNIAQLSAAIDFTLGGPLSELIFNGDIVYSEDDCKLLDKQIYLLVKLEETGRKKIKFEKFPDVYTPKRREKMDKKIQSFSAALCEEFHEEIVAEIIHLLARKLVLQQTVSDSELLGIVQPFLPIATGQMLNKLQIFVGKLLLPPAPEPTNAHPSVRHSEKALVCPSALFTVDEQQIYSENDRLQQNGAFCSSVVWSVGHRNGTIGALCLECGQVLWEMDTDAQLTDHIVNNHPEYMPNSLAANMAPATADSQIVPTYVDEQGELWQCVDIATNGESAEEMFQRNGAQPLQQQQQNEEKKFLLGCAFYGASLSCCFRAIWVGQQRAIFQSLGHNHPPVTVEAFPMQAQLIDQSSSTESVMETIERVLQQDNSTFVDAAGKEWHWLADVSAPGGETELRRACRANGMKKSVLFDTLQKVTNAISAHFPDAVLLSVLGNHDSAPGNSFTDHPAKQQIYEKMFKMWEQWIGQEGEESFTRGGYYRAETSAGLFLVLNTNIYYESNPLRKELVEPDDPTGQFDFLQFELEKARQKGVPVHILGHVPPGAFEEYSVNKLEMEQIPQKYNQKFVDLLVEYAPQIGWIFFGHYHTDIFRVIKNSDGKAVQRFFTAPALTPAFQKNNPAFRVADYNTDTMELENMKTYYVELDELNRNGADGTRAKLEYSMRDAFGGLDAQTLDAHIQKAKRNGTVFDALIRHNHVMYEWNSNWGLNATQRSVHLCALEFVD